MEFARTGRQIASIRQSTSGAHCYDAEMTITKLEYEDGTNRFNIPAVQARVGEQLEKDERPYFTSVRRPANHDNVLVEISVLGRHFKTERPALDVKTDDQLANFVVNVIKSVASKIDREPAQ